MKAMDVLSIGKLSKQSGVNIEMSTAETKCAGSRRDSVPVGLREKGFEALVWC